MPTHPGSRPTKAITQLCSSSCPAYNTILVAQALARWLPHRGQCPPSWKNPSRAQVHRAVCITRPALSTGFLLLQPPEGPHHTVLSGRLRCVRSEAGNRWQCPELPSPLIYQEPTASPAGAVICLHATLLRNLPRSFSGPYAALQSWPWDGQRKFGAYASQLQASAPLPELDWY